MATFTRTPLGLGVALPVTVNYRKQGAEHPTDAQITGAIDSWTKRLTDANGVAFTGSTNPIDPAIQELTWRRTQPAGVAIWMNFNSALPSPSLSWALKYRGITPMINLEHPNNPTYVNGDYQTTNVYTRIAAGDFDAWFDDLAGWAADYAALANDPVNPISPAPTQTLKNVALSSYTRIILRPFFEFNNSIFPWRITNEDPSATTQAVAAFQAAWKHMHDRVRVHGGATNVRLFMCFANAGDAFRKVPGNYWPTNSGANAVKNYTQFLGLDKYDSDGEGSPLLFDGAGFEQNYQAIFEFGASDLPMLLGEYGIHFVNEDQGTRGDGKNDVCADSTIATNNQCRGTWFWDSLTKDGVGIWDRSHNRWRACKGMFLMDVDLCDKGSQGGSGDPAEWSNWAIRDGSSIDNGSGDPPAAGDGWCGAAITGRGSSSGSMIDQYARSQRGTNDSQFRGRTGFFET